MDMKSFLLASILLGITFCASAQHIDSTKTKKNRISTGVSGEIYNEKGWTNHWVRQKEFAYERRNKKVGFIIEYNRYFGEKSRKHPSIYVVDLVFRRDIDIIKATLIFPELSVPFIKYPITLGIGPSFTRMLENYYKAIIRYPTYIHPIAGGRLSYDWGVNILAEFRYPIFRRWDIGVKANYCYYLKGKPMYGVGLNGGFLF
jgi:hypothetical protein